MDPAATTTAGPHDSVGSSAGQLGMELLVDGPRSDPTSLGLHSNTPSGSGPMLQSGVLDSELGQLTCVQSDQRMQCYVRAGIF